jgi:integral membrane protein
VSEIRDPHAARRALGFFKVMAFAVGVGLLILTLEVILHYGFQNESLAWWSPIHGVLFMVYVVSVANLGFKVGWTMGKMVLLMLAGMVPLLSFWAERKVAREIEPRLAGSLAA